MHDFHEPTTSEKIYITVYNLIEPMLVAFIMATTMEIAQISSAVYLLITLGVLTPCLLTTNLSLVKTKYALSYVIILTAFGSTLLKMWIYIPFTTGITDITSN